MYVTSQLMVWTHVNDGDEKGVSEHLKLMPTIAQRGSERMVTFIMNIMNQMLEEQENLFKICVVHRLLNYGCRTS